MIKPFPATREEKREALMSAVSSIRDVLRSSSEESERLSTLSESAVTALDESGLLRMKLPEQFGGAETDPVTQLEVIEEVTYADAAAGWCLMIGASSIGFPAAFLGDQALSKMMRRDYVPRASTAFVPSGSATPTDGGYLLSGRWLFASGVRHAEWINAGAMVQQGGDQAAPEHRMFTLPASEATILDNWDVIGLKGTGSCDISLENVFVPHAFMFDLVHGEPKRGGPLYSLGIPGLIANEHAAFAFGVARRALDTIIEASKSKMRGIPPTLLADRESFQRMIGECDVRLRSARSYTRELNEQAWQTVVAGQKPGMKLQIELRSAVAHATDVAVDVVTKAYRASGGSAVYQTNVLQRCLRDINTAAQHLMVSDSAYALHGRLALGATDVNPLG